MHEVSSQVEICILFTVRNAYIYRLSMCCEIVKCNTCRPIWSVINLSSGIVLWGIGKYLNAAFIKCPCRLSIIADGCNYKVASV